MELPTRAGGFIFLELEHHLRGVCHVPDSVGDYRGIRKRSPTWKLNQLHRTAEWIAGAF